MPDSGPGTRDHPCPQELKALRRQHIWVNYKKIRQLANSITVILWLLQTLNPESGGLHVKCNLTCCFLKNSFRCIVTQPLITVFTFKCHEASSYSIFYYNPKPLVQCLTDPRWIINGFFGKLKNNNNKKKHLLKEELTTNIKLAYKKFVKGNAEF